MCQITNCVCRTRRNPAALPPSAHRPVNVADAAYRVAIGATTGPLPSTIGTIAHGGTANARRAAARNSRKGSMAPRKF
jgi:hypothetical protein